jgi:hypothetical protein
MSTQSDPFERYCGAQNDEPQRPLCRLRVKPDVWMDGTVAGVAMHT